MGIQKTPISPSAALADAEDDEDATSNKRKSKQSLLKAMNPL